MMKSVCIRQTIAGVFLIAALLFCGGCGPEPLETQPSRYPDSLTGVGEAASMTADAETYSRQAPLEIGLTIENLSEEELAYGKDYILEVKEDSGWRMLMLHGEVEAIGILLQPGQTNQETVEIPEEDAGRLAAGEYRLIKEISAEPLAVYFALT